MTEKIKKDINITTLQYINTILLGLLTLSVTVGAFQLSTLNDKYAAQVEKQAILNSRLGFVTDNTAAIAVELDELEHRVERLETILPKNELKPTK